MNSSLFATEPSAPEDNNAGWFLELLSAPAGLVVCAILLGTIGLWLLLRYRDLSCRWIGSLSVVLGLFSLVCVVGPWLGDWFETVGFWTIAGVAMFAAVATISSRNPVYSAIWFAGSLLATGGLFLFQGAQFLGVATVVVYAGAIVVTLLFVLMLAQSEGAALYDRVSWGSIPVLLAALAGSTVIGGITFATHDISGTPGGVATSRETGDDDGVFARQHVAHLGAQLFTRHLIAIEVAGTLLLVGLVGAIAITLQGTQAPASPEGQGDE